MHEQSKAAKRRFHDGNFQTKYFRGNGIDIGCGNDSLDKVARYAFPGILSVKNWDIQDGDAELLASVPDNTFDFAHASHCLEHMVDVNRALKNWIRAVKPGGYVVITVPEEMMYEKMHWPSQFNSDHKWSFTLKHGSRMPKTINVLEMCLQVDDIATVDKIELINEFYDELINPNYDQTMLPNAECCIEIILRKNS